MLSRVCVVKNMCGQTNIQSRWNNQKWIQGLLILAEYFCAQLYVKIPLFNPFWQFDFFWQTDRLTKKAIVEAPPPELKNCKIASEQQSFCIQLIAFVCTIGDDNFFLHRCKWQNACNSAICNFFKWYFNCYLILALLHLATILFTLAVVNFCMTHLVVNFCMHY